MLTEKANVICLLQILAEYSDEKHPMAMREILAKMNSLYGIKPDRRTIYGATALLLEMGYDISLFEENGKGYYLKSRSFEASEVRLLMDAVYSFPFLPQKHSADLIKKLQSQLSVHERKHLKHLTILREGGKTNNRQVFYTIEQLEDAISRRVKVKFTYLQYDIQKKLVARREKKYTVNPYGMIFTNEHYYLVCNLAYQQNISLYRIDRMKDLTLTEYALDDRGLGFDPQESAAQAVYAFTGKPENITMICKRHILDHVIDKFGANVRISEKDENQLKIELTASPKGVKFWALQYLPYVEVRTPLWLREEIIESVKRNKYMEN